MSRELVAPTSKAKREGQSAPPKPDAANGGRGWVGRLMHRPTVGAFIGTAFVFTFFAIFASGNGFVTASGTANWVNQAAELGIVAVPVGLLMIGGEFDLSIASVIGLSSLTVSVGTGKYGLPLVGSIGIALILALGVGLINGLVTVKTRLPSFIVTLATYLALDGATLYFTRLLTTTTNVGLTTSGWLHALFAGSLHQFNASVIWCAMIVLVAGYVLSRRAFGNWVFATGGDVDAAREAGVPTNRVKVVLFVACALGAALLGVIQALEYSGASVGQGESYIFNAIVAAVVGGVLLQGGYGSAVGILLGAVTFGIVSTGIYYTGWDSDLTEVFLGLLVLAAVLANNFLRRVAERD